jgi:hypothetical protein
MAWPLFEIFVNREAGGWQVSLNPDWDHPENPLMEIVIP